MDELAARCDVGSERLRQSGHEVFNDRPVVSNFRGLGVILSRRRFPLEILDLIPDLLIRSHGFFESSAVELTSANGVHHIFRPLPEVPQTFLAFAVYVSVAFWPFPGGSRSKRFYLFHEMAADLTDYEFLESFAADAQIV